MKKYAAFLMLVVFLFFIKGCQINNSNKNISKSDFKNTDILQDESFEKQIDDMNIKIRYPQIKNSENPEVIKINKMIKEAAINKYYENCNLEGLTLDQSYKVEMHSKELLSIVFYQYAYVAGTAHPKDSCFAVTIDLNTAKKLALSDYIESYEFLENKILSGNCEILCGGLLIRSFDEIVEYIRGGFEDIPINKNTDYFYISKDDGSLCTIIDLPQAGGGYSIIKINKHM